MRAQNFVIKSKLFYHSNLSKEEISNNLKKIKEMIIIYLAQNGYHFTGPSSFSYNYLEMVFRLDLKDKEFKQSMFKSIFGVSEEDQRSSIYFNQIKLKRIEVPFIVKVHIYPGKLKEGIEGFFIEITSKPVIYYRITQMNEKMDVDEEKYSFIVQENTEFIQSLGKAIGFEIIEEPKPLNVYIETIVSEKLKTFGLNNVSSLLSEGKSNIEIGEDGIACLWKTIEHFLQEIVMKIGEKPAGLENPERNLNILKEKGYLSKDILESIKFIIYKGIYIKLKDKDHNNKRLDYFDISLMYSITENFMEYCLDKIIKNRINIKISETEEDKNGEI